MGFVFGVDIDYVCLFVLVEMGEVVVGCGVVGCVYVGLLMMK